MPEKLQAAKRAAKAALEDAKTADDRRDRAQRAISDAESEAVAARGRAFQASLSAGASGLLAQPNPGADIAREHALRDAEAAEQRGRVAQRSRDRALDDLQDAQRLGDKAEREYEDAAQEAAAKLGALVSMTPQAFPVTGTPTAATGGPGSPAGVAPIAMRTGSPKSDEEDDKPFWKDPIGWTRDKAEDGVGWAWEQTEGYANGFKEGVVGLVDGAGTLYRLSAVNQRINPDSHDREVDKLAQSFEFAKDNPGEFAKAVTNWEDLSHGRYGEWFGNLAPDAALAVATGGLGTAASRGVRGAKIVGDGPTIHSRADLHVPESPPYVRDSLPELSGTQREAFRGGIHEPRDSRPATVSIGPRQAAQSTPGAGSAMSRP